LSGGDSSKRDSWCFKSTKCSWILTKHSIAQNHGLFLTLVSVFIEHDSHVCLPGAWLCYFFPPS
jgi:hypothetical protein